MVAEIRKAMQEAAYPCSSEKWIEPVELQRQVCSAWSLWHASPKQRTDVGVRLPNLIRQAHTCVRSHNGMERRRAGAAAGDLYRLVQRLLAHICEPELHTLAVERGRVFSEEADTPLALASAIWSSAVSMCASGHYVDSVQLAELGGKMLKPLVEQGSSEAIALCGSLQLEAAVAYGLAGREGDALRFLDSAAGIAHRISSGYWHPQTAFEQGNVRIFAVIIHRNLRKPGEAIKAADRIDLKTVPSVIRRSRLYLETAEAFSDRGEIANAIAHLESAAQISAEAVALIPWARTLANVLVSVLHEKIGAGPSNWPRDWIRWY